VDLPGDELLANAAFAVDENRKLGGGDPLDSIADLTHHLTRTNQRRRTVSSHVVAP
jgi:hypothetical protein